MGWFDDQVRQRMELDDTVFEDAFKEIADAVMGDKLSSSLNRIVTDDAVSEILRFFHIKEKHVEIPPEITDVNERLDYLLAPYGIMYRNVVLGEKWYNSAVGIYIGTMKEDHSIATLIPGKIFGYYIANPKTGKKIRLNKQTAKLLDKEALCFYKPFPFRKLAIVDLFKFMAEQYSVSDIVLVLALTALTTVFGMLTPLFSKILFSTVLDSKDPVLLTSLMIFMGCSGISGMLISIIRVLVNGRVGIKQNVAVNAAVMMRTLSLQPGFFKEYGSGELSKRTGYVSTLCSTLMNSIGVTTFTSLFSLFYIAQIFYYAPMLVAPALLVILVTVIFTFVSTVMQMGISKKQMVQSTKEAGLGYALISGIQKIKLARAEKRAFAKWGSMYAQSARLTYNPPTFIKMNGVISLAIGLAGTILLYTSAVGSGISVADYYAFNSAYGMVSGAFMSLSGVALKIATIKPIVDMAKPILDAEPETSGERTLVTELSGGIELNNVCFRYNEEMPNVIDGMSLKIHSGEYVAIVGKTGCGKSTLMRLMLGFEKPQKGAIYYDNRDINKLDLKSLRRKIGSVMQDGKLFQGDIYSNIVISAPNMTVDDAWRAAEVAGIAEDIRNMPMGMHTIISEGSGGISGGQRQRLMIARAIAPKPRLLIFDEATSALDNATQKQISDAIDKLKCTRIVIAHRLSTIRHCDRIIVLDNGRIAEEGNYEELVAKNGCFAELVARQRVDLPDTAVS